MTQLETLFDRYRDLRIQGSDIEAVYKIMQDDVIKTLTRQERNELSLRCNQWERDKTVRDLTDAQREALKRAALTNITVKITVCPACETPNAGGFTRCQVCDEPLAVAHTQSRGTTGFPHIMQGSMFGRESDLILKVAGSADRLVLQPQMSPTGLKLGRSIGGVTCDVDLNELGAGNYGVSRLHAIVRFDRGQNRLFVIDNNSTNGTFINGVRIPPEEDTILSDGDELRLGRLAFKVKYG